MVVIYIKIYIYIYISATTIAAITVNVTFTDYTCMCVLRRDDERARDAVQLRPAQEDRRQPITLPRHLGGMQLRTQTNCVYC